MLAKSYRDFMDFMDFMPLGLWTKRAQRGWRGARIVGAAAGATAAGDFGKLHASQPPPVSACACAHLAYWPLWRSSTTLTGRSAGRIFLQDLTNTLPASGGQQDDSHPRASGGRRCP